MVSTNVVLPLSKYATWVGPLHTGPKYPARVTDRSDRMTDRTVVKEALAPEVRRRWCKLRELCFFFFEPPRLERRRLLRAVSDS